MNRWILLPYDGSLAASATLRHAATAVRGGGYRGVVLAVAGIDADALDTLLHEASAVAGLNVLIQLRLLSPADPVGALCKLSGSLTDVVLAAPTGAKGNAPWYAEACRAENIDCPLMVILLQPHELAPSAAAAHPHKSIVRRCVRWVQTRQRRVMEHAAQPAMQATAAQRPGRTEAPVTPAPSRPGSDERAAQPEARRPVERHTLR